MEEVSNTDVEKVETSTPVTRTRKKVESPTESGEGPVTLSSQEVLLSTHTYTSPDDVHSIGTNEDVIPDTVSESRSLLVYDKCKPEDAKIDDKHGGVNLDSSGISGDISRGNRMSADSMESELNSDFSGEFSDNCVRNSTKKKRELTETDDREDPEEEFRKHFLKTFQDLPRISQISLDENHIKPPTERNQKAEIDTEMQNTSNEDMVTIPTNISKSDAAKNEEPEKNIAENIETNFLQNSDIQEKENADEMPSSSNKNM
ncbi:uncharacterized protein LOC26535148 [Drosophila yakuba]|uniref:Uncharacterized protein n=1 Tax=Drosophila yakuba TaxID=7245 RepID=A0A0R1DNB8_DROYA|nr:uncharacterized protein LOC26535148 [Drosophila yakuba]KRJ97138.1 uncharacterized protein Dyak_GE27967 [Drosophila yakuba]